MPIFKRGHHIRKAITQMQKGQTKESFKNLLEHLLEEMDKFEGLPKGFFGAQVIEIYKMLLDLEGATPKETKKNLSALEKWISSSTKNADVGDSKEAE